MEWWIWVVVGLACSVVEIMTPGGFVFVFFGTAAVLVGIGEAVGLLPVFWQQSLAWVVLAVSSLLLFRRRLLVLATPRASHGVDSVTGEIAVASEAIAAQGTGKVEFRGTSWSARNTGDVAVAAGSRCRIERVDGLTLWLHAE